MSERFKNKYRTPSARLQNWDDSRAGAYLLTICTQPRKLTINKYMSIQKKHNMWKRIKHLRRIVLIFLLDNSTKYIIFEVL